ncbi:MAG: hypothetical protein IKJ45_05955 [Kiritimatiellae bacterium]|nr:hypothetical protein [Kiritimatiellia bacterium]
MKFVGMGDIAAVLLLAGIGMLAWRRKNADGKTWTFRVIPFGIMPMVLAGNLVGIPWLCPALTLVAYAFAAYLGGWRLKTPRSRVLRGLWWGTHIVVYFVAFFTFCLVATSVLRTIVRFSPIATEGDWPWTRGRITGELPFAVEYKRAKTLCAEYNKRLLFKSGKRIGLPLDTCGYGPFRVYLLKDGNYCLVDGYGIASNPRYMRVNTKNETVELMYGAGWFSIPEKGYVRGWGGVSNDLAGFSFDMYSGGSLNDEEGWSVKVKGTPVGDSLNGMRLIGEIDTSGRFTKEDQ